jgi:uncharacterized protein (TIGR02271 family)
MDSTNDTISVYEGMDVVGSDGEKLGTVDRVEGNYVVAKKGFFFPTDYYVPADAISSVDNDRVLLNVPKDVVLDQGWDMSPFNEDGTSRYDTGTTTAGTTGYADAESSTSTSAAAYDETSDQPFDHHADQAASHVDDDETLRVPLAEEELSATRRQVDRGSVRIEKDVETEEQSLDVPVTEERVNVNRRVVDRDVAPGDVAFEEDTIDVPVRGEEVDVQKRAHVAEELEVSKDAVERTEHVSDTVRRERARVTDTTGDVEPEIDDDDLDRGKKNTKGVI